MTETTMLRVVTVGMAVLCTLGALVGFYGAGLAAREDWPDVSTAVPLFLLSGISGLLAIVALGMSGYFR